MKREYITNWDKLKYEGIYFSGGECKYKSWYENGKLYSHTFYQNGRRAATGLGQHP